MSDYPGIFWWFGRSRYLTFNAVDCPLTGPTSKAKSALKLGARPLWGLGDDLLVIPSGELVLYW